ncbi:mitochondrial inner membrane protease ATP23 homolog isoform X2 [Limulus polyphemus]|uniref:Mitochondrial inner membrane protease ATP23 n=1 Tax=Limulus polyphemus TaxID=6850 RepID=A0ABM1BA57_LIMPO|nr:mitochondrial inner membrane protease ATP23 homolog isoform X2 [Limulus polyphemus]
MSKKRLQLKILKMTHTMKIPLNFTLKEEGRSIILLGLKPLFLENLGEKSIRQSVNGMYIHAWRKLLFMQTMVTGAVKTPSLTLSPLIKLMMSALKGSGCEVDISRHISCEVCDKKVSGGYDPELNQVVVCQNVARSEWMVQGVLAHEFVHMFDYCRAKLDFRNVDHLACTEVRAANLMHCSFLSAAVEGTASPFHIAKAHSDCVKNKAVASVLAVRNVSEQEAKTAVERVFKRCYNDLEPVGRRLRRNSLDMEKAYRQRFHYGYFD